MTTSAVVYSFLFLHIGVILVVAAYYTLGASLAPRITERARLRFARRPWLPIMLGLLMSIPWIGISIVLLNVPAAGLQFFGAASASLWFLCGLLGGASIAQYIGRVEGEPMSWSHTFRGGLFVVLTWILPIVGWLVMMPLTLAAGIGCLILGLLPMKQSPAQEHLPVQHQAAPVASPSLIPA